MFLNQEKAVIRIGGPGIDDRDDGLHLSDRSLCGSANHELVSLR